MDTRFRVRLIAESAMHCYERIIDHLQNRQDVDPRSQFPSAKSNNFEYIFLDADKEASTDSDSPAPSSDTASDGSGLLSVSTAAEIAMAAQEGPEYNDDASAFASWAPESFRKGHPLTQSQIDH